MAEAPILDAGVPTPGERLHHFRKLLRRHRLLIPMIVLLVTGAALGISFSSPKKYDATSKLLLQADEPIEALVGRPTGAGSTADPERDVNTKVALIKLDTVADRVARKLGLRLSASQLLDEATTKVEGNSDIVAITVRDRDRQRAAKLANAFAQEYVAFRQESARANIDEAARLAGSRLKSLSPDERASAEGRQLEARQRELQIASSLQTGGAEVVRRADAPAGPATPRPVRSGLLGVVLGLIMALGLVLFIELVDRRLKDEEEAQAVFELPIVATIPKPARPSRGVMLDGDREVEEGYGTLAANVVFSTRASKLGALMITSPRSGDGKTSVTLGLARALRMLGQRVIVVEADLHHPRFVQIFNIEQQRGLSALLAGVGRLEDELVPLDAWSRHGSARHGPDDARGVRHTNSGGAHFSLLPAGPVPPNAPAMLSRPAMTEILEECRRQADVVLVDTAPVGLVHDPLTLVNHVDGILLVARLHWTTKDATRRTLRLLGQVSSRILGVVLTGGERTPGYYGDPDYRHYGRPKPKEEVRS